MPLENEKGCLICPICHNIKKIEEYDADIHDGIIICDECNKKHSSFIFEKKSELISDSCEINFDNYHFINLKKVYLQKGRISICADCKMEKVNFQGIHICPKCGKNFFVAIYINNLAEGIGTIHQIFYNFKDIPEAIIELQTQGELLIFGGISPVSGLKIYFVWQPPTEKERKKYQKNK